MKKFFVTFFVLQNFFFFQIYCQEILWWFDLNDSAFGQSCAGDINNDNYLDVVFGCYRNDSCVYALSGKDGSLIWKYNTSTGKAEGCNDVAPLIFDVDGDGKLDVIVPSSCNNKTFCFNGEDGSIKWVSQSRGSDSPPTLGDIDGDGQLEILHGEFLGYVICFDAKTGKRKWEILVQPNTWIQTAPTLIDLDGDGLLDFVVSTWCLSKSDTNRIYAFRGYDQRLIWKKDLLGTVYHGTSLVDINSDGKPELVFGDYSGKLYVLNSEDGSEIWSYTDEFLYYIGSPSSIGDLDGDGMCEIVFTSAFDVLALKIDGSIFWKYRFLNDTPSFRGVALSDVDNDNLLDVVLGTTQGKVVVLKGKNGNPISIINLQQHLGKSYSIDHCPLVADFNRDGNLDIFVVGGKTDYPDFSKNYGRAYLISFNKGNGPEWLMFQNNIHRTGSVCGFIENIVEHKSSGNCIDLYYNNLQHNLAINIKCNFANDYKIYIYNILGCRVYEYNEEKNIGNHTINIDLNRFNVGIYFIKLSAKNESETSFFYFIK